MYLRIAHPRQPRGAIGHAPLAASKVPVSNTVSTWVNTHSQHICSSGSTGSRGRRGGGQGEQRTHQMSPP